VGPTLLIRDEEVKNVSIPPWCTFRNKSLPMFDKWTPSCVKNSGLGLMSGY